MDRIGHNRQWTRIVVGGGLFLVCLMLIRTFLLTPYYLPSSGAGAKSSFETPGIVFVYRPVHVERGDAVVYYDHQHLRVGYCMAIPSETVQIDSLASIVAPTKGNILLIDSLRLPLMIGLVEQELMSMDGLLDEKQMRAYQTYRVLRSHDDYYIVSPTPISANETLFQPPLIYVRSSDIRGRVIGSFPLPF